MSWYSVGAARYNTTRAALGLIICVLAACSPIRGCVESNFELAPESRLPKWVQVPASAKRADVSVELEYYVPPSQRIDNTVFIVGIKGQSSSTFTARHWWHPRTKKQLDAFYTTVPRPKSPDPSSTGTPNRIVNRLVLCSG